MSENGFGRFALRDTAAGYGIVSRAIHWLTAGLLVGSFWLAWTWGAVARGPAQAAMVDRHRMLGIAILALTLLRLVWRAGGRRPDHPGLPRWNRWLARGVQAALAALLVAIPVAGWAYSNAGGVSVAVFGWPLPGPLPRDTYLASLAVDVHEALATGLLVLIGLHVLGALRHGWQIRNSRPAVQAVRRP